MFAVYGLLTRYAGRRDSTATSFFWTGTVGAVAMTAPGRVVLGADESRATGSGWGACA